MTWDKVPKDKRHGAIRSYRVNYTSATSTETKSKQVRASTKHLEVDGLEQNTNYTVMASTSKGYGPASDPIFVATDLESKSISALTFTNKQRCYDA